ncbi:protein of unknown function [Nitrospira japonica]|uniref:Cytochrome c domain-containing protein n=1 Tax=Nitrospira japonica TaxID=1325564 RepID=A0A1W1I301_9BACT|nr:cytochrome c [Nitrospira japonica]SLM47259.1 protein of unknown function [Nitrospira japonica]
MSIDRASAVRVLSLYVMVMAILQGNVLQSSAGGPQDGSVQRGTIPSSPDGNAVRGKELYNVSCVVCHGKDAGGNIGPRLAGNAILANGQAFRKTVQEGRHMMPPLKDALTDEQIADILAWLKSLP